MKRILNITDFTNTLKNYQDKKSASTKEYLGIRMFEGYAETEELVIIENLEIREIDFWGASFSGFQFRNCNFVGCEFHRNISIDACIFKDCRFISSRLDDVHFSMCDFIDTNFENCIHTYNIFGDTVFRNVNFINSKEMLEIYFGGCKIEGLVFSNCHIMHSRFEDLKDPIPKDLIYDECIIMKSYFYELNLTESSFQDSKINQNSFNYCTLSSDTIKASTKSTGKEFSSIDFQTIINSPNLPLDVLNNCFGIQDSSIKDYMHGLTQKIEFQSVFISYSFEDKDFANRLNSSLISKGVFTFLWEKDATGGKGLKKIMKENIQKHDRIIFISSENSIKSDACQFELSEGRKKQAKLWSEIFFPLHIDDYLFKVEKDDIKPNSVRDEFWDNICEIKEINSLDFKSFNNSSYNKEEYDNMIYKLVQELKK